jgi:hypothetical protein
MVVLKKTDSIDGKEWGVCGNRPRCEPEMIHMRKLLKKLILIHVQVFDGKKMHFVLVRAAFTVVVNGEEQRRIFDK